MKKAYLINKYKDTAGDIYFTLGHYFITKNTLALISDVN